MLISEGTELRDEDSFTQDSPPESKRMGSGEDTQLLKGPLQLNCRRENYWQPLRMDFPQKMIFYRSWSSRIGEGLQCYI